MCKALRRFRKATYWVSAAHNDDRPNPLNPADTRDVDTQGSVGQRRGYRLNIKEAGGPSKTGKRLLNTADLEFIPTGTGLNDMILVAL